MVMVDAFANMAMIIIFFFAFPKRVFHNEIICLGIGVLRGVIVVINRFKNYFSFQNYFSSRLNPLVVILYRVLMVCYADFCRNIGERKIRQTLLM